MRKLRILMLLLALPMVVALKAQIVTTTPDPLQEDSEGVTIFFHANEGNKGLMGVPASTAIYAHTGVCVADENGTVTEWKYAPEWLTNTEKYQLSYVSENLWKLYIGDIREYYGLAQTETVKKLCFVFRNADGSKEGKDTGNADIFVDVLDGGFQLNFRQSRLYNVLNAATANITFTGVATEACEMKITLNGETLATGTDVKELKATYTFTTLGDYKATCTATKDGVTRTQNINLVYVDQSPKAADTTVPKPGLTKNADGSFTFCLPAPEKQAVVVVGSWNNYVPTKEGIMEYVDRMIDGVAFRYFKTTIPGSVTGKDFSYYYTVDTKTSVGDPYARLVLDPDNDKYIAEETFPGMPQYPTGLVPTQTTLAHYSDKMLDYKWEVEKFWYPNKDNLIIYEMLFRDFTGTEGEAKGNGTVRKAIEKIPYLKELGINAVELLPINEFNGNNSWGYNPNYYFAIDKAYGTPQDYKEFIDKCHANGIAVILDVVFNQADWQHPWYRMYTVGQNPFFNATAPHAYSVLNDWNQGYPLVEEQWKDMLQFWLEEYRVDGFRFDLVKGLGNNDSYANSGDSGTNAYNASRVARMKRLHDAMRQVNSQAFFINENLAGQKEENEMAQDGELNWANLNNAGCQFAMGYKSDSNLSGMNASKYGRTPGSTVAYLESHDEERLAYKQITWGVAGVKDNHAAACQRLGGAAAQMILTPGAHMIWMFSELGNAQSTKGSSGNNTSPKIVNWALLDDPDNAGVHNSYRELISIRRDNPELFPIEGSFANLCSGWENGRSIITTNAEKEVYCMINPNTTGDLTFDVQFQSTDADKYWISSKSYGSEPSFDVAAKTITVPANCYVVVSTKNVTGIRDMMDEMNDNFKVITSNGVISVRNTSGNVDIYTLNGAKAATLRGDGDINVAPGLYAVRHQGKAIKVIVK